MDSTPPQPWYVLERDQPFARSLLWTLQRDFYSDLGTAAWGEAGVPHYVTTSASIAESYAQVVFAFLCDRRRLGDDCSEPLWICELGGGSGRFALQFLHRLGRLLDQEGLPRTAVRYVFTDHAEKNLLHCRAHPLFQPFLQSGALETARFDLEQGGDLLLQGSGERLGPGGLARPLVVIANYVFDSVPQDLFYLVDGSCSAGLVSLAVQGDPASLPRNELLERLRYRYDRCPAPEPVYPEEALHSLMEEYRGALGEAWLLFPAAGLRCLQGLRGLSRQGLLLLAADKGVHELGAWEQAGPPQLVVHAGCFSLNTNFHALRAHVERTGGLALMPEAGEGSLDAVCYLWVERPEAHAETLRAYRRHLGELGPDDLCQILRHAAENSAGLSIEQLLAFLRLGRYDGSDLAALLPRLVELAPSLDGVQQRAVLAAVERTLEAWLPLDDEAGLATGIAALRARLGSPVAQSMGTAPIGTLHASK